MYERNGPRVRYYICSCNLNYIPMDLKRLAVPLLGAALVGGEVTGAGLTAMAASSPMTMATRGGHGRSGFSDVSGVVTAINGSTITVTTSSGGVYTVDASSAVVSKYVNGVISKGTVATIAVGDTVMIRGTIETATMSSVSIRDGNFPKPTPPTAIGKVTAVNGSTITLSSSVHPMKAGGTSPATTYTVDASGATISKVTPPAARGEKPKTSTISVSGIVVGDTLVVRGTLSGTSITATSITDRAGFFGGMGHRRK